MSEKGEEVLRVVIEDDASSPARTASDALERLQKAFDDLSAGGAEKYFGSIKGGAEGAAKEFKRLGDIGKTAGSALASAMSGTQNRMLAAVQGTSKLSSALELATKRARELKAAEDRAFSQAMARSNYVPNALQGSAGPVSGFRKIVGFIGSTFGDKAAGGFVKGAEALTKGAEKLEPLMPVLGGIAATGAAAAVAVGVAAVKFGSAVVGAQAYREDVEGALEIITKSKRGADDVLDRISATSDDLGIKRSEAADKFVSLMNKGLSSDKAEEVIKRLADLGEANPSAPLDALNDAIGTISSKGEFAAKSLTALAEAGIKSDDVYAALEKQLKKTRPELEKMMSSGKITGQQGVDAVLEAIKQKTGGGDAGALAASESMSDMAALIKRVENIPSGLLFDIDAGPGMEKVKGQLRDIIDFFSASSASGKEVRQVLGDTFNAIAEGLFGIDTSKSTGIKDTLQAILDTVKGSKESIKDFASAVRVTGAAVAWLAGIGASTAAWWDKWGTYIELALAPLFMLKLAIQATVAIFDSAPRVGDWFASIGASIANAAAGVWDAAVGIGSKIVDGLIAGVKAGAAAAGGAVLDLVGGMLNAAQGPKGVDAHSPSKKTTQFGIWTAEGFELGIERRRDRVASASERLASIAAGGGKTANDNAESLAAPRPAGGASIGSISVAVQVAGAPVGASSQEHAEVIGRVVRREMMQVVRGLLREAS